MFIPETIKAELKKRREKAQREAEKRMEIIRAKAPEIDDLELAMKQAAFLHGTHAFSSYGSLYEEEHDSVIKEIEELKEKRKKLLESLGYPSDYLDVHYTCPVCCDKGYVSQTEMCKCAKELTARYKYYDLGLDSDISFENFNADVFPDEKQRQRMKKVYKLAKEYADSLPAPEKPNFLLLGASGLGKSYTLNCIVRRAFEKDMDVVRVNSYNMFNAILKGIREEDREPDFLSCDLLAIDDLGAEPMMKNITVESLFRIVNERYERKKATIVASNLTPEDLITRYGDRTASRLLSTEHSIVINLYGKDVRLS